MRLAALLAGTALALVPAGTASAGETGQGKAWGNCKNSSAGGVHAPLGPERPGNGNGGLRGVTHCVVPVDDGADAGASDAVGSVATGDSQDVVVVDILDT